MKMELQSDGKINCFKLDFKEEVMAVVTCTMNCVHRSKRPLRKWKRKDGKKCYGCTLEAVTISRICDPDNYIIDVVGEEEMASCANYEPIEN